jgi:hypothetical protein
MILHLSLAMAYHNIGQIVGGLEGTNYLSIYYLIVCPLLNATTSTNWKYGIAHNFGTCAGLRVEVVTMISHCDF